MVSYNLPNKQKTSASDFKDRPQPHLHTCQPYTLKHTYVLDLLSGEIFSNKTHVNTGKATHDANAVMDLVKWKWNMVVIDVVAEVKKEKTRRNRDDKNNVNACFLVSLELLRLLERTDDRRMCTAFRSHSIFHRVASGFCSSA